MSSGDLVDRVALAIAEAEIGGYLPGPIEATGEQSAASFRKLARAAIDAMREPTQEMIVAGLRRNKGMTSPNSLALDWQAMIDEALK